MTVEELIEKLKQFPSDTRVLVDGYEGGYDEPKVKELRVVARETPQSFWGNWDDPYDDEAPGERAVVVAR